MTLDRFFIRLRQLMWAQRGRYERGELSRLMWKMWTGIMIFFVSCEGKAINYYWIFKYHSFPLFPPWKWKRSAGEENFIMYFYGNITFYLYFGIENVLKRQQSPERYFYLFLRCSYSWAFALNNFLAYPLHFRSFRSERNASNFFRADVNRNGLQQARNLRRDVSDDARPCLFIFPAMIMFHDDGSFLTFTTINFQFKFYF